MQLQSLAARVTDTKDADRSAVPAADSYIDAALQAHPVAPIVEAEAAPKSADECYPALAAGVLRKVLMPLAAAPLLFWFFEARVAVDPPGAALSLGILAVIESFVLLLLGLWIQGDESSPDRIERISVAAAASLFASTGVQAIVLPGSVAVMPMFGAAVLITVLTPTCKGLIALAAFVLGGWAACWLVNPDAAAWPTVGLSLSGLLALAAVLGHSVRKWQAAQLTEMERQKQQYRDLLDVPLPQPDNNTQRILQAHGELDGLWEWNLKEDQIYFSPRWRALLGYGDHSQTGHPDTWFNLIHPYDLDELMNRVSSHLDGKTPYFECEHRIRQADGTYRWVLSHGRTVLGPDGEPERLAGSQTDIKRMKNFEAQLVHEATHDRLTGLANRQHLLEALEETFQKYQRSGTGLFAVAFMDLDRFKSVNDTLGHHVGDELLRLVAQRIQKAVRDQDLAVRLGGDEFVILMRSVHSLEDAMEVARRIRDLMTEKLVIGPHEILTAASIGVALSSAETTNGSEIMRNADIAMYQAKSSGRGQVLAFDSEMGRVMSRSFSLQSDMAKALENDEFELHYQPLVNPIDGKIMGAEALIRWRRASDELVFPAEFIGLAEESGMIVQIGHWVFARACRQLKDWIADGLEPIKISINFSARELADMGTSDVVARVLKESGIDPKWLQVEITESDLVDGRLSTVESLDRLSLLGINTAIDDFGTGYSALSYLRKLTCSVLKIDQSFVHDIESDPKASALARSIINMAHNLQLGVVAEGVETKEQLAILRDFGCDLIQGYLASRPIPADEFKELLKTGCAEAMGIEAAVSLGRHRRRRR